MLNMSCSLTSYATVRTDTARHIVLDTAAPLLPLLHPGVMMARVLLMPCVRLTRG